MRQMFKWIKFILTDEDNQWDLGVLLWVVYNGVYLFKGATAPVFDFQAFGFGGAALLAGGAGLQWIRTKGKDATTTSISGS